MQDDLPRFFFNFHLLPCLLSYSWVIKTLITNDYLKFLSIVCLYVLGVAVADAKGPKKILKHKVSEAALQCLNKFCHTVVTNKEIIQHYDTVSRYFMILLS